MRALGIKGLLFLAAVPGLLPTSAAADQASQPTSPAAGHLATGKYHTCAVLANGGVRCWGYGGDGALGYGNRDSVGDDEAPAAAGPVNLGPGRTATALSAGDYHTCAVLDDGTVRCWGFGADGRLGYDSTNSVGASQTPGSVAPVDLGPGRTARSISAGGGHTCALLDDASVRCWGYALNGELGYGNTNSVGASQTPGSVGPVNLGPGRTATAISAGGRHTCALLDDGSLRCWGNGGSGRLGYGNASNIGDHQTPDTVGPVSLGAGRTAVAISAGNAHTCAILDNGSLRCWGFGASGQLGYGSPNNLGDSPGTTPDKLDSVNLGPGRTAKAITTGNAHTCALLDNGSVRCWGYGGNGRLGYGSTYSVGDQKTPDSAGPVSMGPGRRVVAISAGNAHTCALLDDDSVRCWGDGANGRLGYCNTNDVGGTPTATPNRAGPVKFQSGDRGTGCSGHQVDPRRVEALRAKGLRGCLSRAAHREMRQRGRARTNCIRRYGRIPGAITRLRARAISSTKVLLSLAASGTDARHPPATRAYLIVQALRPIHTARDFARADALCSGRCRFPVRSVDQRISLTVTHLRPHTRYYYAVSALDNVSGERGPRSQSVSARTG